MKQKLFKIIKNKYVLVSLAFIVWVGFIDSDYSIIRQNELSSNIRNLNSFKLHLEQEIEKNKQLADKLENDIKFVEKFAREEFDMKGEDEDVYVIVTDE